MVVYGPPLAGKTALAWEVARSMPGKAAVVSTDALLDGAIAVASGDAASELDMVHTQVRLLVANYMRNGYHVVVEGAFCYSRGGVWFDFQRDIDQLIALMRNMTERALLVQLEAAPELLRERALATGRAGDLEAAERLAGFYRPRYGPNAMKLDATGAVSDLAERIMEKLGLDEAS